MINKIILQNYKFRKLCDINKKCLVIKYSDVIRIEFDNILCDNVTMFIPSLNKIYKTTEEYFFDRQFNNTN